MINFKQMNNNNTKFKFMNNYMNVEAFLVSFSYNCCQLNVFFRALFKYSEQGTTLKKY